MKTKFHQIASVLLAFLVLLSTFSVTVEKHFCGDFLVDVSYFGNLQGCSLEMDSSCETSKRTIKKKCCKDEIQQIDGQDELQKVSVEKFDIQKQQFVLAFAFSYHNLFSSFSSEEKLHKYYSPPDVVKDIQVLHEVFLI